jgi:hypothetical protein
VHITLRRRVGWGSRIAGQSSAHHEPGYIPLLASELYGLQLIPTVLETARSKRPPQSNGRFPYPSNEVPLPGFWACFFKQADLFLGGLSAD